MNVDYEAKSLDNLEIHLKTCEIYECEDCEYVSKQLSGIKQHISEIQKCSSSNILHIKMDRNNDQLASCTEYKQSDIF